MPSLQLLHDGESWVDRHGLRGHHERHGTVAKSMCYQEALHVTGEPRTDVSRRKVKVRIKC